jgi:hypothetical protein
LNAIEPLKVIRSLSLSSRPATILQSTEVVNISHQYRDLVKVRLIPCPLPHVKAEQEQLAMVHLTHLREEAETVGEVKEESLWPWIAGGAVLRIAAVVGVGLCVLNLYWRSRGIFSLRLQSRRRNYTYEGFFYVLGNLQKTLPSHQVKSHRGLSLLRLADEAYFQPKKIDLLLGAEAMAEILTSGSIGKVHGFITLPSKFGLLLGGVGRVDAAEHRQTLSFFNRERACSRSDSEDEEARAPLAVMAASAVNPGGEGLARAAAAVGELPPERPALVLEEPQATGARARAPARMMERSPMEREAEALRSEKKAWHNCVEKFCEIHLDDGERAARRLPEEPEEVAPTRAFGQNNPRQGRRGGRGGRSLSWRSSPGMYLAYLIAVICLTGVEAQAGAKPEEETRVTALISGVASFTLETVNNQW